MLPSISEHEIKHADIFLDFQSLKSDWAEQLADKIHGNPYLAVLNEAIGINHIQESNYALFNDDVIMHYLLNGKCFIKEVPINMFPTYGHMGYRKDMRYAGVIDQQLVIVK